MGFGFDRETLAFASGIYPNNDVLGISGGRFKIQADTEQTSFPKRGRLSGMDHFACPLFGAGHQWNLHSIYNWHHVSLVLRVLTHLVLFNLYFYIPSTLRST